MGEDGGMDGIRNFKNQPLQALQDIVARCRPYFDRGESHLLPAVERRQYYAALFQLAERGGLESVDWGTRGASRPRDDRQRTSLDVPRPSRRDLATNAA
jgi:DNA primase